MDLKKVIKNILIKTGKIVPRRKKLFTLRKKKLTPKQKRQHALSQKDYYRKHKHQIRFKRKLK